MLDPNSILQNRYRIVRELGHGGMGTVYEALDQRLNCLVALKETSAENNDAARRAFEREASLLGNLRHQSLPKVMDYFSEGGGDFLVMEFIPGYDLAELLELRGSPFPQAQVIRWADGLLKVMEYLHGQQPPILHRDIKPSNLKLTKQGEIFLLDFGLAKGATGQMPAPASKSIHGYTPVYASLEQIHGLGTDPRSDLYSLGATLYHLLTNTPPIDAPARFLVIEDDQPDPLPPIDKANPEVSPGIAAVVQRALAINRKQRPTGAAEMRKALRDASEEDAQLAVEEEYRRAEVIGQQREADKLKADQNAEQLAEQERQRQEAERRRRAEAQKRETEQQRDDEATRTAAAERLRRQAQAEREQEEMDRQRQAQAARERQEEIDRQRQAQAERNEQEEKEQRLRREAEHRQQEIEAEARARAAAEAAQRAAEQRQSEERARQRAKLAVTQAAPNVEPETPVPPRPIIKTIKAPLPDVESHQEERDESAELPPVVDSGSTRKRTRTRALVIVVITVGSLALALLIWLVLGRATSNQASTESVQSSGTQTVKPSPEKPAAPEGMVYVPGGSFMMGRDDADESERPAHNVSIKPFFIDLHEVTKDDYLRFVIATRQGTHPSPKGMTTVSSSSGNGRLPVTGVDWDDANAYAKWAGKRLPTEEEWEFAARGTDGRRYAWGNDWQDGLANAGNVSKGMAEVGKYKGASPFGLVDMIGNAWEWTAGEFTAYPGGRPIKPSGDLRVIRGGTFNSDRNVATTTYRRGYPMRGVVYDNTGFRCVKDVQ